MIANLTAILLHCTPLQNMTWYILGLTFPVIGNLILWLDWPWKTKILVIKFCTKKHYISKYQYSIVPLRFILLESKLKKGINNVIFLNSFTEVIWNDTTKVDSFEKQHLHFGGDNNNINQIGMMYPNKSFWLWRHLSIFCCLYVFVERYQLLFNRIQQNK